MLLDEEAVEIERLLKDQVYLSKKAGEAHQLLLQTSQQPGQQVAQ